tara:strand:+ start:2448 stop:3563 length:1116 start_codon:yes stop_codon:yes gene_type:complete
MDDFNLGSLNESRNEWVSRLLNVMTPNIADGFKALFTDAYTLCLENDEIEKYLMTFQNFLGRIPKWNEELISNEVERITNNSGCGYLEDLITCVHVVQLKALTCIRVGQKQKKVDIDIPKLSEFVHKCYINVARKLYSNIYLFEKDVTPLQVQRHSREFEIIVKEGIINAVRESIPVEQILRSYLDETTEEDVEVQEEIVEEEKPVEDDPNVVRREVTEILDKDQETMKLKTNDNIVIKDEAQIKLDIVDTLSNNSSIESNSEPTITKIQNTMVKPSSPAKSISFNNTDRAMSPTGLEENIDAPKTVERLERISHEQNEKRKLEEMADDFDDEDKITIGAPIGNDILGKVENISPKSSVGPPLLEGVEILS